jgi:hypothetical protein
MMTPGISASSGFFQARQPRCPTKIVFRYLEFAEKRGFLGHRRTRLQEAKIVLAYVLAKRLTLHIELARTQAGSNFGSVAFSLSPHDVID